MTTAGRLLAGLLVGFGVAAWSLLALPGLEQRMALLKKWNKVAFLN
jgi:hypothetical protein